MDTETARIDELARALMRVISDSHLDPVHKPLAALIAAGSVAVLAARANECLRHRITHALLALLREVSPEVVVDLPRTTPQAN